MRIRVELRIRWWCRLFGLLAKLGGCCVCFLRPGSGYSAEENYTKQKGPQSGAGGLKPSDVRAGLIKWKAPHDGPPSSRRGPQHRFCLNRGGVRSTARASPGRAPPINLPTCGGQPIPSVPQQPTLFRLHGPSGPGGHRRIRVDLLDRAVIPATPPPSTRGPQCASDGGSDRGTEPSRYCWFLRSILHRSSPRRSPPRPNPR